MRGMKTLLEKIDKNQIDEQILAKAGEILKQGGLVAFPTEIILIRIVENIKSYILPQFIASLMPWGICITVREHIVRTFMFGTRMTMAERYSLIAKTMVIKFLDWLLPKLMMKAMFIFILTLIMY